MRGNSIKKLAYFDNGGVSLRSGTTDPVIAPDSKHVAFIRDHSAYIAELKKSGLGRQTLIAHGNKGGAGLLPLNTFIVGFTVDSKSLYYSVAPGRDPCPDCPKHQIAPQKADYGLFRYDLATQMSSRIQMPDSSRVHPAIATDKLFVTDVGPYGDQFGVYELSSKNFVAFPKECASALSCQLDSKSQRATCLQVISGKSKVVECDIAKGSSAILAPEGSCPVKYQQPSRSPSGAHVAYFQTSDDCRGKNRTLVFDEKPIFQCDDLSAYGWVGNERLLVHCGDHIDLVSSTGEKLNTIFAPQSENRLPD